MKLQRFIPIAVMAVLAVAGCNPTQKSKPASEVAGNYNGYATAEFQYSPVPVASDGQSVAVVMETDETVSVSYKSDTWGTFTITGVSVSSDNGTYTLSGKGKTVMGMSADSQKEYECNLNAVVSGQDDFVFTFDVPAVMGGLKITVKPGKVPAELVVSGTYKGVMDLSVMGNSAGTVEDATVTVDAVSDDITVTTSPMGMGSMTIGSMVIGGVKMTEDGGAYILKQDKIDITVGELKVTGTMEGKITSDGKAVFEFVIKPGAMPMPVTVAFEGNK